MAITSLYVVVLQGGAERWVEACSLPDAQADAFSLYGDAVERVVGEFDDCELPYSCHSVEALSFGTIGWL